MPERKSQVTDRGFAISENRRLYYELWGTGRQTVLIEVGSTMPGTSDPGWWPIRDALIGEASVLLYDRAGLGRSDPAPLPRPLERFTTDLQAVLLASKAPEPYMLVGGSFGGMLVLDYASRYPHHAAGVLLVDSTHPAHNRRALAALPPASVDEPAALRQFRTMLWQEEYAPRETGEWEGLASAEPDWNLGDIPLIVLTAGQDEWEPGFPVNAAESYEAVWRNLQCEMAALSSNSRHITVKDSDHIIHYRQPGVVLHAIRSLLAAQIG